MSTIAVHYRLSEAARRRIGAETGTVPPTANWLIIDLAECSPEQRAALLSEPKLLTETEFVMGCYIGKPPTEAAYRSGIGPIHVPFANLVPAVERIVELASVPSVDEVMAHLAAMSAEIETMPEQARRTQLQKFIEQHRQYMTNDYTSSGDAMYWLNNAVKPELRGDDEIAQAALRMAEEFNAWRIVRNAEKAAEQKAKYEAEQRAEAEKESKRTAKLQTRIAWAAEYGSDQLKRGLAAGHDCARLYYTERAAVEYPGFVVDFGDKAAWKARACPSVAALDVLDATNDAHPEAEVEIVWMTTPPGADDDDTEHEGVEAVVANDPNFPDWLVRAIGE